MNPDTDERAAHFEGVARGALARELDSASEPLERAAGTLRSTLRRGDAADDTAAEAIQRYGWKATEYADHAVRSYKRVRALPGESATARLHQAGGTAWIALLDAGQRLDDGQASGTGLLDEPTPAEAARYLRDAWRTLADVADEHGEPLPPALSPPTDTDADSDRDSAPKRPRDTGPDMATPMTPERLRSELEADIAAADRAGVDADEIASVLQQYADACRNRDPFVFDDTDDELGEP